MSNRELAQLVASTNTFKDELESQQFVALGTVGEWEPLVSGVEDLLEQQEFDTEEDLDYWHELAEVMANAESVEEEAEDDSDDLAAIFGL